MLNYGICFNFLNPAPQTSYFCLFFQGFQRLCISWTRSATESLANSGLLGLPAVFPHPSKMMFPDV